MTTSDLTGTARGSDQVTTAAERQSGIADRQSGSAAAIQAEARQTFRQSVAAEMPLSGKALGSMYSRGERWGRDRIAEVRAEDAASSGAVIRQRERQSAGQDQSAEEAAEAAVSVLPVRQPSGKAAVTPAIRWTTTAAVVLVAVVAAAVSYEHMRHLAAGVGEGWRAWLLPLAVDGLMVAASMNMLVRKRLGLSAGWLSWCSLLAGVAASLAANVAAAEATLTGRLIAAWPPLALLMAYELLMQQVKAGREDR